MYGAFRKIRDLLKLKQYLKPFKKPPVMTVAPTKPKLLVKNLLDSAANPITEFKPAPKVNAIDWRKMNLKPDLLN